MAYQSSIPLYRDPIYIMDVQIEIRDFNRKFHAVPTDKLILRLQNIRALLTAAKEDLDRAPSAAGEQEYSLAWDDYECLKIRVQIASRKARILAETERPARAPAPTTLPALVTAKPAARPLRQAPDKRDVGAVKAYNLDLMKNETLVDLKNGFYIAPSGTRRSLDCRAAAASAQLFINAGKEEVRPGNENTQIYVREGDVLQIAEDHYRRGLDPIVLDAASSDHFGGGYLYDGPRAEEEDICRRSGLSLAMDTQHGLQRTNFYPLQRQGAIKDPKSGVRFYTPYAGVYVGHVPVYRSTFSTSYAYLEEPFPVAVSIMAAYRKPPLVKDPKTGELLLRDKEAVDTRGKLRTICEMAYKKGHKSIVFVPLGCGAFGNPPAHIARLFIDVVKKEFPRCFKEVCVACIDDHNTGQGHNKEGNFLPFARCIIANGGKAFRANGHEVTSEEVS